MGKKRARAYKSKRSCPKKIFDLLKLFDQYGRDIQLTYQGESQFKTHLGGVISILFICLLFAYFVFLLNKMFKYQQINLQMNMLEDDITGNATIIPLE